MSWSMYSLPYTNSSSSTRHLKIRKKKTTKAYDNCNKSLYFGTSKLHKIVLQLILRKVQLQSRLDAADTLAETNKSLFICTTYTSNSHFVTILEEHSLLVALDGNGILTIVALLQETSKLRRRGTANSARAQQVTGLERTSVDGVVCEHLWEGPHQVSSVGFAHCGLLPDAASMG